MSTCSAKQSVGRSSSNYINTSMICITYPQTLKKNIWEVKQNITQTSLNTSWYSVGSLLYYLQYVLKQNHLLSLCVELFSATMHHEGQNMALRIGWGSGVGRVGAVQTFLNLWAWLYRWPAHTYFKGLDEMESISVGYSRAWLQSFWIPNCAPIQ